MKKIAADHISRRMQPAAVGDLNHCHVRIGMRIGVAWVSWVDADVMMRKTLDQLAARSDRPFFEVRRHPVGIRENKICNTRFAVFLGPVRRADESRNDSCECRR